MQSRKYDCAAILSLHAHHYNTWVVYCGESILITIRNILIPSVPKFGQVVSVKSATRGDFIVTSHRFWPRRAADVAIFEVKPSRESIKLEQSQLSDLYHWLPAKVLTAIDVKICYIVKLQLGPSPCRSCLVLKETKVWGRDLSDNAAFVDSAIEILSAS